MSKIYRVFFVFILMEILKNIEQLNVVLWSFLKFGNSLVNDQTFCRIVFGTTACWAVILY